MMPPDDEPEDEPDDEPDEDPDEEPEDEPPSLPPPGLPGDELDEHPQASAVAVAADPRRRMV